MPRLEDEIPDLEALDKHRATVRAFLRDGREALKGLDVDGDTKGWDSSQGPIERALLVKVQNRIRLGSAVPGMVERVKGTRLVRDLLDEKDSELRIPVILAARLMQALAASSEGAFTRTAMVCYYRVLREIFVADSPDWSAGGARAGNGGDATAYVTGQCVRAILGFVQTLQRTGAFFRETHEMYDRLTRLEQANLIGPWCEVEVRRIGLAWYTSTDAKLGEIAMRLDRTEPQGWVDSAYLWNYLEVLKQRLPINIAQGIREFEAALAEVDAAREAERNVADADEGHRLMRSESAHLIARAMIEQAVRHSKAAAELCADPERRLDNLGRLGDLFDGIAENVRRALSPAIRFVGTVLDRELAAASSPRKPVWDVRELAFAAAAFGAATERWDDERLTRACILLSETVGESGEFPLGRPYHSTPNGLRWETLGFEVCESFAFLLQAVDVPAQPALVQRLLQPFVRNQHRLNSGVGWHFEHPPVPKRPIIWVSTLAVLALDRLLRMLNQKINGRVFPYFSVKDATHSVGSLGLDDLTYGDYGRELAGTSAFVHEAEERHSVAFTLELMRAHLLNVKPPRNPGMPRFCSIFYGPPGTGKTTLLRALAYSCRVPLVELSPSDIATGGQEEIESRARAIFLALSMLTKVVIIFDEFEPVLQRRRGAEQDERNIFTFLTPSMLPKLTRLYERAKEQRVVYCLVTNHLEKLDRAAIREGRFDTRIGIYPPDPVSRIGKLQFSMAGYVGCCRNGWEARYRRTIQQSAGEQVHRLAKRWFARPPAAGASEVNAWEYVVNDGKWPLLERKPALWEEKRGTPARGGYRLEVDDGRVNLFPLDGTDGRREVDGDEDRYEQWLLKWEMLLRDAAPGPDLGDWHRRVLAPEPWQQAMIPVLAVDRRKRGRSPGTVQGKRPRGRRVEDAVDAAATMPGAPEVPLP